MRFFFESVRYPCEDITVITYLGVLQAWRSGTKKGKIDRSNRGGKECTIFDEKVHYTHIRFGDGNSRLQYLIIYLVF